jgi:tetratricopeptide (TPR) repeat protein
MKFIRHAFLALSVVIVSAAGSVLSAQQPADHPGVEFYKQGKIDQAIASLEAATNNKQYSSSGEIWNFLGLAYFAKDDLKQARRAFERAVKLSPDAAAYHGNLAFVYLLMRKLDDCRAEAGRAIVLDPKNPNAFLILGRLNLWEDKLDEAERNALQLIAIEPSLPQGYVLRSNVLTSRIGDQVAAGWDVSDEIELLKEANDVLQTGVSKSRNNPNHKVIEDAAESVSAFYTYFARDISDQPKAGPNDTPLKIIQRFRPTDADVERISGVPGTIRIAALFGADARVKHTLVLNRLGYGLDELVEAAARRTKFVPQMRDGKPVATVKILEYTIGRY